MKTYSNVERDKISEFQQKYQEKYRSNWGSWYDPSTKTLVVYDDDDMTIVEYNGWNIRIQPEIFGTRSYSVSPANQNNLSKDFLADVQMQMDGSWYEYLPKTNLEAIERIIEDNFLECTPICHESDYLQEDDDIKIVKSDCDCIHEGVKKSSKTVLVYNKPAEKWNIKKPTQRKSIHHAWAKMVKYRDKKCLLCGSEKDLHAHHIKRYSEDKENWSLENGVTYCKPCHKEFHKKMLAK